MALPTVSAGASFVYPTLGIIARGNRLTDVFTHAITQMEESVNYYWVTGNIPQAWLCFAKKLKLQVQAFGIGHVDVLTTSHTVCREIIWLEERGRFYRSMDHHDLALRLFDERLTLMREAFGEENPVVHGARYDVGACYLQLRNFAKAFDCLSYAVGDVVLSDRDKAVFWESYGLYYLQQEECNSAELCFGQAVALGKQDIAMAVLWERLAIVHQGQGNYAGSTGCLLQALGIKQALLGPIHPEVAEVWLYFGFENVTRQRERVAIECFLRAHSIFEVCEVPDRAALVLCHIGNSYQRQGQEEMAVRYFSRELDAIRHAFGPDSQQETTVLHNLGFSYQRQRNYKMAYECFQQEYAIARRFWGDEDSFVCASLRNMEEACKALELDCTTF